MDVNVRTLRSGKSLHVSSDSLPVIDANSNVDPIHEPSTLLASTSFSFPCQPDKVCKVSGTSSHRTTSRRARKTELERQLRIIDLELRSLKLEKQKLSLESQEDSGSDSSYDEEQCVYDCALPTEPYRR